jgi:hypothetical protein
MSCELVREAAAVALLTREPLGPEVRQHIAACPACYDEVAAMGELPSLLDEAAELAAAGEVGAPHAMLDRLLAAAAERRAERRRRVRRVAVLAAAAALVLVLLPVGIWSWSQHGGGGGIWHGTATSASGVTAELQLQPADVGSNLAMSITGVPPGTMCTLVVHTADGGQQTAATWAASYVGTAHVTGTVAAAVPAVRVVDVVDQATGRVLVQVPGPG